MRQCHHHNSCFSLLHILFLHQSTQRKGKQKTRNHNVTPSPISFFPFSIESVKSFALLPCISLHWQKHLFIFSLLWKMEQKANSTRSPLWVYNSASIADSYIKRSSCKQQNENSNQQLLMLITVAETCSPCNLTNCLKDVAWTSPSRNRNRMLSGKNALSHCVIHFVISLSWNMTICDC